MGVANYGLWMLATSTLGLMGMADQEGDLLFTSNLDTVNHMVSEPEHPKEVIRVRVVPLDFILKDVDPVIIKIDVEGMETRVILGLSDTLQKKSLHSVIMELNGSGARYGFNDDAIIKMMFELGFRMYTYEPFSRKLLRVSKENKNSGNVLFLRHEEYILQRIAVAPRFKVGRREF